MTQHAAVSDNGQFNCERPMSGDRSHLVRTTATRTCVCAASKTLPLSVMPQFRYAATADWSASLVLRVQRSIMPSITRSTSAFLFSFRLAWPSKLHKHCIDTCQNVTKLHASCLFSSACLYAEVCVSSSKSSGVPQRILR